MKTVVCKKTNQNIALIEKIADSGEGEVWTTNWKGMLAKLYHHPTPDRFAKLEIMINHQPQDPNKHLHHCSFAFPQSLIKDNQGKLLGFLMPQIRDAVELINIYNPKQRKLRKLEIDWHFLHCVALNIASIMGAIHREGYVIGDIKPQNILVNSQALPCFIDTDSFQVKDPNAKKLYPCLVGTDGYTPPELIGQDFHQIEQNIYHDNFRLGVLIYQLLFSYHPFCLGNWQGSGEKPDPNELIKQGIWIESNHNILCHNQNTIPLNIIHPQIKKLLRKCFNDGHDNPHLRPSAEEWFNVLTLAIKNLTICTQVESHIYYSFTNSCYWCERKDKLHTDIFELPEGIKSTSKIRLINSHQNKLVSYNCLSDSLKKPNIEPYINNKSSKNLRLSKLNSVNNVNDIQKNHKYNLVNERYIIFAYLTNIIIIIINSIKIVNIFLYITISFLFLLITLYLRFKKTPISIYRKNIITDLKKLEQEKTKIEKTIDNYHQKVNQEEGWYEKQKKSLDDTETKEIEQIHLSLQQLRLIEIQTEISNLDRDKNQEMAYKLTEIQTLFINNRLSKTFIEPGLIKGIGENYTDKLNVAGIITAKDIEYHKVLKINGIGDYRASKLVNWKNSLKYQAQQNMPKQLSISVKNDINWKYTDKLNKLQKEKNIIENDIQNKTFSVVQKYKVLRKNLKLQLDNNLREIDKTLQLQYPNILINKDTLKIINNQISNLTQKLNHHKNWNFLTYLAKVLFFI